MVMCRLISGAPSAAIVSAVAELEAALFPTPWGADSLLATLTQPCTLLAIAESEHGSLAAYCIVQQVLDEATVLQVATAIAFQRQGLAQRLCQLCENALRASGCATLWLEVRAKNAAAISLYERLGFVTAALRKRYYPALPSGEPEDDARVMRLDLADQTA